MNRTPRPVPGSRRAAVANAYAADRRIKERDAIALKKRQTLSAMQQIAQAADRARAQAEKPKGPKRGPNGRFLPKNAD